MIRIRVLLDVRHEFRKVSRVGQKRIDGKCPFDAQVVEVQIDGRVQLHFPIVLRRVRLRTNLPRQRAMPPRRRGVAASVLTHLVQTTRSLDQRAKQWLRIFLKHEHLANQCRIHPGLGNLGYVVRCLETREMDSCP